MFLELFKVNVKSRDEFRNKKGHCCHHLLVIICIHVTKYARKVRFNYISTFLLLIKKKCVCFNNSCSSPYISEKRRRNERAEAARQRETIRKDVAPNNCPMSNSAALVRVRHIGTSWYTCGMRTDRAYLMFYVYVTLAINNSSSGRISNRTTDLFIYLYYAT